MAVIGLKDLCSPAIFYLAISLITIFMMFYQNYTNTDVYCLGVFSCKPQLNNYVIFITMILVVLFWTWILNIICHNGSTPIAWFLVLLPYIIFLIMTLYVLFM
jgi:hypothetical protein